MVLTRSQNTLEVRVKTLEKELSTLKMKVTNLTQENINLKKEIKLRKSNQLSPPKGATLKTSNPDLSVSCTSKDSEPKLTSPALNSPSSKNSLPSQSPSTLDSPKLSRSFVDVVKGLKSRPTPPPNFISPNPFQVLASDFPSDPANSSDSSEPSPSKAVTSNKKKVTIILGDSNIKRVNRFISCKPKNKDKVKIIGTSGAKIQDCEKVIEKELASRQDTKVQVILHAGTNNVHVEGTETIINRYKNFVNKVNTVHSDTNVVICSLPDRHDKGNTTFSRVIAINNRLPKLCLEVKASALRMESKLHNMNMPYLHPDGLHYNQAGAFVAADIMAGAADHFLG